MTQLRRTSERLLKNKKFHGFVGLLALLPVWAHAAAYEALKMESSPSSFTVSHEMKADVGYVAGAKAHLGHADFGHISEQNSSFQYVSSTQVDDGILLRLGMDWQRFSFGLPARAPLPNTLQSISPVVGADFELSDRWLMRVESKPGIYSDFQDFSFDDVNAPLIAGFSYLVNQDLQWFAGLSVNPRRDIPVLPGGGARWKFADQWTLMMMFPKPHLSYEMSENLSLFVGGEIKGDTYKVARDFGSSTGRPNLNNAAVDFTEVRLGAGLSLKVMPGFTLDIEGGYMPYRQFDFHSAGSRVVNNGGAPYGQIGLSAGF